MENLERAYSVIHVKSQSEDEEYFTFSGVATTPTPDRMNDIVDPLGASFAKTIPLLWQHNSEKPVGHTEFGKPTKAGIPFTARIPIIKEAGALKDRIDEAIQSVKYSLVAAVSIGFKALNNAVERIDNGGLKFLETEIMELSLVTIPANSEAVISAVKSIDQKAMAAISRKALDLDIETPGDTGKTARRPIQLIPSRRAKS